MPMIYKAAVGIAVGIAGIFVGYCFYFDQKRRSDPDFKKKLRERRRAKQQAQKAGSKILDLKHHEIIQKFFLQEIQIAEELLSQGDVNTSVEHLSNAIAVCGQPAQLLQVLQKTLPPSVFYLLLHRIPNASQKLLLPTTMAEDDVE